ncbi:MAG: hypothetical protein ABI647_21555 [Gemmatimonadota bacterium]
MGRQNAAAGAPDEPAEIRIWTPEHRMSTPNCKTRTPEAPDELAEIRIWTPEHRMSTPNCEIRTPERRMSSPK